MVERANPHLVEEVAAAFAWWREAGVDCLFHDDPTDWIAPPPPPEIPGLHPIALVAAKAEDDASALPVIDRAAIPQDLAAFTHWWLAEPMLDDGRVIGRVPPRGPIGAELMVIVAEPEREDRDALLSGREGALLEAMLAAMAIAPAQTYFASALPRHMPMADFAELGRLGLGEVLARHVKLVKPRLVMTFGSNVLSLLGNGPPYSGHFSQQFKHEDDSIPLFAAAELGVLLARPRTKGRLWRQWLDWTGIGTA